MKMINLYSLVSLLLLFCLSACVSRQESKKFVIAFSQCVGNDAWRETMLDEMKRELSFYPDIHFLYRDAEGNNEKQIQQIRELLKEEIDILIVSPNEAAPLTSIVDSVYQMNIPVIVTDRKTSSGLYNAYVGADNVAIGYLAGKYIQQIQNNQGKVAIVKGLQGSSASIEREKGFRQSIDHQSDLTIAVELQGNWEKEEAFHQAMKHKEALMNCAVILAFNDQMALGVNQALSDQHGEMPKIIGVDALPGAGNGLEEITKGTLYASMLYPTGGTDAIRTAIAILNRMPYNRENILGTLVINKENAGIMALQSNKIQEQQKDIDKRQELLNEQNRIYKNQQNTLNIVVASLVLTVVFGGISVIVIKSNWEKNKHLETQNQEILSQQQKIVEMSTSIQKASETKSIFFTNVSHEFKTPLTLILAPLEELEKEKSITNDGKDQLMRIKRNAKKLQNLVNELIDIHRLEKSSLKLHASPIKINTFFQHLLANFKPLAHKKRVSLSYVNKTQIKDLWLDEFLMEQVISNLLSNAFKFTSSGGKISIVIEENNFGDYAYMRVIDNGAGISLIDIDHIFDPFYQGENSSLGSGIGLAYVKEIVELHHGQITVSSKQNLGTSFTMRIPIGNAHLSEEELKPAPPYPTSYYPDLDQVWTMEESELEQEASFISNKVANILIIDDHLDIRQFLKTVLEKEYNVAFAKNYSEAKLKIEKSFPDLVISDIMLPDGSGLDLLKMMKSESRTAQIPVLLLSALDTEEAKIEGIELMADAYLSKPFAVGHLKALISNLITSRIQLKEHFTSSVQQDKIGIDKDYSEQDKRFLQHLAAIVESRLSDPFLNVEEIAEKLSLSRVQLYRKTKNLLNYSVNDYVLKCRLDKSKYLIVEGYNVNEVAERVGFSSPAYFTSTFKKQYGMTPTAYKKNIIK